MVLPYPELALPSLTTTMNNLRDRHSKNMFFVIRLPDLQGLWVGPGSPSEFQHTHEPRSPYRGDNPAHTPGRQDARSNALFDAFRRRSDTPWWEASSTD